MPSDFEKIVKSTYPPPIKTDESYVKQLQHCSRCGYKYSVVNPNKRKPSTCPKCGGQGYSQHPQLEDRTEHTH